MKKLLAIFATMLLMGIMITGCPGDTEEGTDDTVNASTDGDNPCADNPCADNPCADNPCGDMDDGDNPCGDMDDGDMDDGDNPCGDMDDD